MSDHCCGNNPKEENKHPHEHGHKHHNHKHTNKVNLSRKWKSVNELPSDHKQSSFKVEGMDCADEIASIESSFASEQDVFRVEANLMSSTVVIYHHEKKAEEHLKKLINKSGVTVVEEGKENRSLLYSLRTLLVATSGVATVLGLIVHFNEWNTILAMGLFVLATITGGVLIVPKAWRSIKNKRLDINVLMTFAVIGAFYIKEYSEAATVVFLFSFAELLEAFSVERARKAVRSVLKNAPKNVHLLKEDGSFALEDVNNVKIGQVIQVKSGEAIGLDGEVLKGTSFVDQASITGESILVSKEAGDEVFAGTLNTDGTLDIKVTSVFKDTKISQIIKLIEEAQSKKAPAENFVDGFAKYYTPLMLLVSLLIMVIPPLFFNGVWDEWIYRALVLLVIGCPCALVLSTPVAVVSGLTALAKKGVLVKGGIYLENLSKLSYLCVDKTGTLTYGRPKVKKIASFKNEQELLEVAATIEQFSIHPLALAVLEYAKNKKIILQPAVNYQSVSGLGAKAEINGHNYFLGNLKFLHQYQLQNTGAVEEILKQFGEEALTVIVVGHASHDGCSGEVLGVIGLEDEVREGIQGVVKNIFSSGIKKIVMLSGDSQAIADKVARQVGINQAVGGLLPDGKVREIEELKKTGKVAMVGDGVNDAPSMAIADIGIAMGKVGAGVTVESADIVLMQDDLTHLPQAILHGKKTLNIIKFNIIFALLLKLVFLVYTAFGYSSLWIAVAADTGASLFVIFNSLRLLKLK